MASASTSSHIAGARRAMSTTTAATTLRKADGLVLDGPYAETKEQLLGFYIVDVETLEEGLQFARELTEANPGGAYELRPVGLYLPGTPVSNATGAQG